MHYAGRRRSEHNPLRSASLFRTAAVLSGPTETDRLVGELRNALWSVRGYVVAYDKARAALGKANRHNPTWRRMSQRDAMRTLNVARAAMRANSCRVALLQTRLLALAAPADLWADAAASAAQVIA